MSSIFYRIVCSHKASETKFFCARFDDLAKDVYISTHEQNAFLYTTEKVALEHLARFNDPKDILTGKKYLELGYNNFRIEKISIEVCST